MIVVDHEKIVSLYEKVFECNYVGDVLVPVPGNTRSCTKALVDKAGDETYIILIPETPEFIAVSTGEDFNAAYVVYGLVGTLYFSVY